MNYITTFPLYTHKIASEVIKHYIKKYNKIFLLLYGNLGSGKTEFVKGVAKGLEFSEKQIKSPTFVYIIELDNKKYKLFHIDFYRIDKKFVGDIIYDLLENIDLEKRKSVFCFEWADKISYKTKLLLANIKQSITVEIKFKIISSTERRIYVYEK